MRGLGRTEKHVMGTVYWSVRSMFWDQVEMMVAEYSGVLNATKLFILN